jgi:hypothetical protein
LAVHEREDTTMGQKNVARLSKKFRTDPVYNNHLGYLAAKAGGEAMKAVNANVDDKARFLAGRLGMNTGVGSTFLENIKMCRGTEGADPAPLHGTVPVGPARRHLTS